VERGEIIFLFLYMLLVDYVFNKADKRLKYGKASKGGRNFLGRICVYGRGGGHKHLYRFVDFVRRVNSLGEILRVIRDLTRSAFLGLVLYPNGLMSYIILSSFNLVGDKVYSGLPFENIMVKNIGWAVPLRNIGLFSVINNIELKPVAGSKIVRSAGCSCILIGKNKSSVILKLTSG